MAMPKLLAVCFLVCVLSVFSPLVHGQDLSPGFYKKTCPTLEAISRQITSGFVNQDRTLAAALLRMHYHDCFVRGCDGSVLLNSTKNNPSEKESIFNLSLRGFEVIDAVKLAVERKCPGVVSCADILAIVARDAVSLINGPSWPVPLGRKDGRISNASEATEELPAAAFDIGQLKESFISKGLSVKDLAVLSGAHTIGVAHCPPFSNRLYNFTGKGDSDPNMDPKFLSDLKNTCKPGDVTTSVEMDTGSSTKFDVSYYKNVNNRKGLFQSDAALLDDSQTKAYIKQAANSLGTQFFNDFADSMIKMSKMGVLTGQKGEIRKQCAVVNPKEKSASIDLSLLEDFDLAVQIL